MTGFYLLSPACEENIAIEFIKCDDLSVQIDEGKSLVRIFEECTKIRFGFGNRSIGFHLRRDIGYADAYSENVSIGRANRIEKASEPNILAIKTVTLGFGFDRFSLQCTSDIMTNCILTLGRH